MLSKEECLQALEHLKEYVNADNVDDMVVFSRLIKEHFDEKGNRKAIANISFDSETLKELVDKAIKEFISVEPYKFEDLKDGMFVYEINLDNIYLIYYTTENIKTGARYIYACGCGDSRLTQLKFEENSFFPVQMANVGCE